MVDFNRMLDRLKEWKRKKALAKCDCLTESARLCYQWGLNTEQEQDCKCKCHREGEV